MTTDRLARIEERLHTASRTPYPTPPSDASHMSSYDDAYNMGAEAGVAWMNDHDAIDLAALLAVVCRVKEIHRRIHLGDGRWICAICPTATPSGALEPTLWPCPTAAAVQGLDS